MVQARTDSENRVKSPTGANNRTINDPSQAGSTSTSGSEAFDIDESV